MKRIKKSNTSKLALVILFIIIAVALWVRLGHIEYPLRSLDVGREHLVARHIVEFGEFTWTGVAGSLGGIGNPALYEYILAGILTIQDSYWALEEASIIIFLINIVLIFWLAKILFEKDTTAIIAALFFTLSWWGLKTSLHPWRVYWMLPFLNLSFILTALFHKKPAVYKAAGSLLLLFVAGAIHKSAFLLLPLWGLLFF